MGRKNDHERQKRRQKRQDRHRQKRSGAQFQPSVGGYGPDPRPATIAACISMCRALLEDFEPLAEELRRKLTDKSAVLGGVWARVVLGLDAFLCEGKPWSITCDDLGPLRAAFDREGAEEVYTRLWALCLTNDPQTYAPAAAGNLIAEELEEDHACRLGFAVWRLRACLTEEALDPKPALAAIKSSVLRSVHAMAIAKQYIKLMESALNSIRSQHRTRKGAPPKEAQIAADCTAFIAKHASEYSKTGWWQCGCVFLREVFHRHALRTGTQCLLDYPVVLKQLYGISVPDAWRSDRARAAQALRGIHYQSFNSEWMFFLMQNLAREQLPFEARVRCEIAGVKLLLAGATGIPIDVSVREARGFYTAFEQLLALLAHGVPPAGRHLPSLLDPLLLEFYIESVRKLNCYRLNLALTEAFMKRYPGDYRLACLFVTGVLMSGHRERLQALAGKELRRHVDPGLYARCAEVWQRRPGSEAGRNLLFDPLDKEQRKHCLTQLATRALRSAASLAECHAALDDLLPHFGRDSFVYADLRRGAALEKELVFFGVLTAARQRVELPTLSYGQLLQFIGFASELAGQLPSAAALAAQFFEQHPLIWFDMRDGARRLQALAEGTQAGLFNALRPIFKRWLGEVRTAGEAPADYQGLTQVLGKRGYRVDPPRANRRPRQSRRGQTGEDRQLGLFDAPDA